MSNVIQFLRSDDPLAPLPLTVAPGEPVAVLDHTGKVDFYVGDKYPAWGNSLLVSGLHSSQVSRVLLKDDGIAQKTRLRMNMRVRDLQVGPDGFIYLLAAGSRLVRLEIESP